MSRQTSKRHAIQEDLKDLDQLEDEKDFWSTYDPEEMDQA